MNVADICKILESLASTDTKEFVLETQGYKLVINRGKDVVYQQQAATSQSVSPVAQSVVQPSSNLLGANTVDTVFTQPEVVEVVSQASTPAVQVQNTPAIVPANENVSNSNLIEIKAPIVGTFYAAASPDADDFVSVGDKVDANSVLCIIEAMKLMNEIEAEVAGVVKEILVKNEEPVEYGQVLFRIEPS